MREKSESRSLLLLILLSFALRLAIAACSWGTTDMLSFMRFAFSIDRVGLLNTYRIDSEFNHPPLPAYWAWLALRLTGRSPYAAAFVFRLAPILADAGSTWLLWSIARRKPRKSDYAHPLRLAALFAWCPVAILISAYHGNTDSIYAFLCLLSVYFLEESNGPFLAGLALAAAINIKLIPMLLILPLLLSFRKISEAGKFLAGLVPGVIPFIIPLVWAEPNFAHNVLAYRSNFDLWGINLLLSGAASDRSNLPHAVLMYRNVGRFLLAGLVIGWSLRARSADRWNRYDIAAATFAIFLVFASGFGVQYLVAILPLLFAARPRIATIYGLLAGAFLLMSYWLFWDGNFPFSSLFNRTFPPVVGFIGLPTWCLLVYYLAKLPASSTETKRLARN
jgi:hypothetical protein